MTSVSPPSWPGHQLDLFLCMLLLLSAWSPGLLSWIFWKERCHQGQENKNLCQSTMP